MNSIYFSFCSLQINWPLPGRCWGLYVDCLLWSPSVFMEVHWPNTLSLIICFLWSIVVSVGRVAPPQSIEEVRRPMAARHSVACKVHRIVHPNGIDNNEPGNWFIRFHRVPLRCEVIRAPIHMPVFVLGEKVKDKSMYERVGWFLSSHGSSGNAVL